MNRDAYTNAVKAIDSDDDRYVGNYINDLEHGKGMYKKHDSYSF